MNQILEYINNGQLETAKQLSMVLSGNDKYSILNKIAEKYEKIGEFNECLNLSFEIIRNASKDNIVVEVLGGILNKSISYIRLFDYDNAAFTINEAILFIEQIDEIAKNNDFYKYEASLYNIRGLYARYMGDVNAALEYYLQSLKIRRNINDTQGIAVSLANISTIYQIKGEIDLALEHNLEAMQIFMQMNNEILIAYCLHDIGLSYRMKGDLSISLNFFLKALNSRMKLDNKESLAETLYELVHLSLEINDLGKAKLYFNKLSELNDESASKIITLRYNICNASIIKSSDRIISRSDALQIFKEIAFDDIIDHELNVFVLLNLCDLLLYEYKMIKNEIILHELGVITQTLIEIANQQKSYSLLSKTYLLLYRLNLIKLDLKQAQLMLMKAYETAETQNLEKLLEFITEERITFTNKMRRYNLLIDSNNSVLEKIEEENLHETLNLLLKKKNINVKLNKFDEPVFILLLNNTGVSLFTKSFNNNEVINKNLIGGFLMASDLGISNAIKGKNGSIESIKYGKYNLIFQNIDDLTSCYAFIGPFHMAVQRLDNFLKEIKAHSKLWELLHKKLVRPKLIYKDIIDIVNIIFE